MEATSVPCAHPGNVSAPCPQLLAQAPPELSHPPTPITGRCSPVLHSLHYLPSCSPGQRPPKVSRTPALLPPPSALHPLHQRKLLEAQTPLRALRVSFLFPPWLPSPGSRSCPPLGRRTPQLCMPAPPCPWALLGSPWPPFHLVSPLVQGSQRPLPSCAQAPLGPSQVCDAALLCGAWRGGGGSLIPWAPQPHMGPVKKWVRQTHSTTSWPRQRPWPGAGGARHEACTSLLRPGWRWGCGVPAEQPRVGMTSLLSQLHACCMSAPPAHTCCHLTSWGCKVGDWVSVSSLRR